MGLANYSELKSSVADWLNRSDLTALVPDFIKLTEAKLNREVRHYKMHNRANATLDTQFSAVPADWLEVVRFTLTEGNTYVLEPSSPSEISRRRAEGINTTGRPQLFCVSGDSFEVFPTPNGSYVSELVYFQKIPALSDSNTTNWLLTEYPDAYLYGALLEATPYVLDDERMVLWTQMYASTIANINAASDNSKTGGPLKLRVRKY